MFEAVFVCKEMSIQIKARLGGGGGGGGGRDR